MHKLTRLSFVMALACLGLGTAEASAAWNNVFQTTCCGGRSSSSSYFAPAPSPCAPSVSYVQRSYYQPVTTYKQETYLEPVTTYKRSYHWEGVTRYRYTSYYDPCTGCSQNVATPYTSYYLRSKCNAVQSYVQRCRMVPVTEMRKSYYLEPVVTYAAPACDSCPNGVAPQAGVTEGPDRMPAGVNETNEPPRIKSPGIPEAFPRTNSNAAPQQPVKPIRTDRVASLSDSGRLRGSMVRDDRITPQSNTTLRFVGDKKGSEITARTDASGRFTVELPAGEWTLYVPGRDGKPVFHSQVFVRNSDDRLVTVVSR